MAKLAIGEVRFSYCNLFKAREPLGGGEPKFSTTVLVPKTDTKTINAINAAVNAAIEEGIKKVWHGIRPPILNIPIHDGDGVRPSDGMPYGDECSGHLVFTASTKDQPQVVDKSKMPILNQSDVYSGMYGYVSLSFYPYNQQKKGVGCGLSNVMKTRDGEPLGNRSSASSDFANVDYNEPSPWEVLVPVDPITGLPLR